MLTLVRRPLYPQSRHENANQYPALLNKVPMALCHQVNMTAMVADHPQRSPDQQDPIPTVPVVLECLPDQEVLLALGTAVPVGDDSFVPGCPCIDGSLLCLTTFRAAGIQDRILHQMAVTMLLHSYSAFSALAAQREDLQPGTSTAYAIQRPPFMLIDIVESGLLVIHLLQNPPVFGFIQSEEIWDRSSATALEEIARDAKDRLDASL